MQALNESGMAEDTITVVTGDHGDMLGERVVRPEVAAGAKGNEGARV